MQCYGAVTAPLETIMAQVELREGADVAKVRRQPLKDVVAVCRHAHEHAQKRIPGAVS
jgi:hypothetical protein